MRRQNRSCDQCRKAKRACDAPSLREIARRGSTSESCQDGLSNPGASSNGDNPDSDPVPCSYCLKTNKRCTLNWARSQLQVAEAAQASRSTEARRAKRQRTDDRREDRRESRAFPSPSQSTRSYRQTVSEGGIVTEGGGILPSTPSGNRTAPINVPLWDTNHNTFGQVPNLATFSEFSNHPSNFVSDAELAALGFNDSHVCSSAAGIIGLPFQGIPEHAAAGLPPRSTYDSVPNNTALWGMLPTPSEMELANHALIGISPQACPSEISPAPAGPVVPPPSNDGSEANQHQHQHHHQHQHQHHPKSSLAIQPMPQTIRRSSFSMLPQSPSSVEHTLIARTNHNTISENLLQIYHDVLEHNLACWITEDTCPYNVPNRVKAKSFTKGLITDSLASPPETNTDKRGWSARLQKKGWGPSWTNRMYHRVMKLDRMAQSTGIIRLTHAQSSASQKAFHLVIMAFATQWAQGSQRQRQTYASDLFDANAVITEEFDRNIQRAFWEQARNALQECTDIESYRVACAEIIFGLTQKPWEEEDFASTNLTGDEPMFVHMANEHRSGGVRAEILSRLSTILAKDGPPVFLERAARKMHTLKFQFDTYESGLKKEDASFQYPQPPKSVPAGPAAKTKITDEESETVGLLYWLAVMCDTISASMNERPVVLADEDSQHEAANDDDDLLDSAQVSALQNRNWQRRNSQRWRIDLFIQDDPERMTQVQYRWPCSYEEAANAVTRSAPVKVLLYRYVHYLQNMLRNTQKSQGEPIEETIRESLLVYRYWNVTYGAFYRDMIDKHASVPARIRGWYLCIVAHWHLGALMLADVIEMVDSNEVGLEAARRIRSNAHTVASIRKSSAGQLSDLARISTPYGLDYADTEPQMPDFHFAVREGTVLTEPWSILLIQAFSRAAVLHLREVDDIREQDGADLLGHDREACRESLRRCEECIQALWLLGKKSDMARNVAIVLSKAMNT